MNQSQITNANFKGQFSGHETFPLRHGWLKKAFDAVESCEGKARADLFKGENAIARFGVGKNMALSIRHWAVVCGIIKEQSDGFLRPTPLAEFLFGDQGVDPYLESKASLWLLHWELAGKRPEKASSWYWAFNLLPALQFDRATIVDHLLLAGEKNAWKKASIATLKRDIDCFLRCYAPRKAKGQTAEENIESVLAELGLILPTSGSTYRFNKGPHTSLPDEVFALCLFDYWRALGSPSVLSVERIAYETGSPGRVFKLDENSIVDRLMAIDGVTDRAASWADTAGLRQVHVHHDIEEEYAFLRSAYTSLEVAA